MYLVPQNDTLLLSEQSANAAAKLELPVVIENGKESEIPFLHRQGDLIVYESAQDRVEIRLKDLGGGLLSICRRWQNLAPYARSIATAFRATPCFDVKKYLIPCVNINGNEFGNGDEPKGLERNGQRWVFSYDRESIPSCTLTENSELSLSLFASAKDATSLVSACSIFKLENGTFCQEIRHPDAELPVCYKDRDLYSDGYAHEIKLEAGESFETEIFLLISKPRWENYGICNTVEAALRFFPKPRPQALPTAREAWDRSIRFAKSLLTDYRGKRGFIIGFTPSDKTESGFAYRGDPYFELAWCGQNILFSRMFVKDYCLTKDPSRLEDALDVLDTRVAHCVAENGLLFSQLRYFENPTETASDTCNMGYGAYEFLRVYEQLREIDIEKEAYLRAGLGLCDFFCEHFSPEFGFGKEWRHDGVCVSKDGSIGAFVIPALAKAFELTREKKYLNLAERAMKFYVERDLDQFCCTAGALDTCCVDKETSTPFLMSAVLLYRLTKNPVYLDYGRKAAYYFASWMYFYQPIYNDTDEISEYQYCVRGLTAVSAQHHHVDCYGGIAVPYFRALAELTGEDIWREIADTMWEAVLQGIGDGTRKIHGKVRPVGSQNEAVFQCTFGFYGRKRGDLNDWLVAWPCAFRLSVLAEEL